VLEYTPECAGDPEEWDWFIRPDVMPTYSPLNSNGTRNPLYFTNRLYEDTWIKVEKQNGVCTPDEIELFLDILDPLTITSFTADYSPICSPIAVDLEVNFVPSPAPAGCSYTVNWYKGGQLIHTSTHISSPAMYSYTPPAGMGLAGNYYCIVESDCCPERRKSTVIVKDPPMEVYATGPCFRCNCDTITLNGIVRYPIPGFICSYQWYDNGLPIPGATGQQLTIDTCRFGPFTFEVTCTDGMTTCVHSDVYNLLQCGSCDPSICYSSVFEMPQLAGQVFPSPTAGMLYLEMEQPVTFVRIEIYNVQGQPAFQLFGEPRSAHFELDLQALAPGLYTLKALSSEDEIFIQKFIKQ
ncbi:MAG: T9SS type A sorting domain-containing protein, partial [Phaeodactylibacter sp.]|nr:T9SS type A sorting domain-containing protein [Phaeodactylibacter sp.]